ncbi:MAG: hypothetical protein IT577_17955 [Verrucomicrobiae bacterium]|nr:hypothetical protein [Verrucomicrobiae bacterium]
MPKSYTYDIAKLREASDAHAGWTETGTLPLPFRAPRALATGSDGIIRAAGDRAVVAIGPEGKQIWRATLPEEPMCLGAGPDGRTYVGFRHHVGILDPAGTLVGEWVSLGENAVITSVAPGPARVWVADAGARKVAIFEPSGKLVGYLQPPEPFVAPSPFFDAAADTSGGVWVANPGCLRVEHYSAEGRRTTHWGRPSMEPPGFAGCCNPIHMALLPDGGFATSEKGIPRVKTYRADGSFAGVVAGPGMFAEDAQGLDLAARSSGDILILDCERRAIRIFKRQEGRGP